MNFHGVKVWWFCQYLRFHEDLISWFPVNASDIICRLNFPGVFNFVDIFFSQNKQN